MSTGRVPAPGPHGGDGARLALALGIAPDDVLDLSASLNPFAPDVVALAAGAATAVNRYPDARDATRELAATIGVDPDRLVLTNGGAEAIALLAAERPTGRVDEPDFALYRRHLGALDGRAARWRSNPHNPTGRLAPASEHADVWDEAFYPLAAGRWTRGDAGAVVLGSLTKVFACPGLRLGYLVAPDAELATRVRARQPAWAVNGIAVAVLPALLAAADLDAWSKGVAELRRDLVAVLERVGLSVEPSDSNFVLCRRAPGLRDHLGRRGVLVRDTGSFGIRDGVRIAVPGSAGLERLETSIEGWGP
jgi:histidinol-phosphate/aromatic aminotransferase/cobyric acid decarboxylase-like protein